MRELQASKDSKEPAAPFRTVALIHMLLYYLYRSFPPMLNVLPQPSFSDRAVQKDMVHFIYEHYQEKITLADISAAGRCPAASAARFSRFTWEARRSTS